MKAIDVASDTTGHGAAIKAAGIGAVGLYLRSDRTSRAMIRDLVIYGVRLFSVFEKGQPTDQRYFTLAMARSDSQLAVNMAGFMGQPEGSQIFFAVDYDANPADVMRYFREVQGVVKAAGYLCSVYGSGRVCAALLAKGYVHSGWLAQSKGWAGYKGFLPRASIVQGGETKLTLRMISSRPPGHDLHLDVDLDEVRDLSVLW